MTCLAQPIVGAHSVLLQSRPQSTLPNKEGRQNMRALSLVAGTLAATLVLSTADVHAASGIPKYISAAVADPARPEADRKADVDRKPEESVAFSGLKPGQKVIDILPGGGYFTRIFSAVVGPKGHVFAVPPPKRPNAPEGAPDPAARVQAIAADPHYSNVTVVATPLTELSVPSTRRCSRR